MSVYTKEVWIACKNIQRLASVHDYKIQAASGVQYTPYKLNRLVFIHKYR